MTNPKFVGAPRVVLPVKDVGRLLLRCADRSGLVAAVTTFLASAGVNIISLDQHSTEQADGISCSALPVGPALAQPPWRPRHVGGHANHRHTVGDLARLGADVERATLSRPVRWHCEDRVTQYGNQTVIF
jgi:formyltetrahydrofolate hydrolase